MQRRSTPIALLTLAALLLSAATAQALPRNFFGLVPQTSIGFADTNRMRHGGIESLRVPVAWPSIQQGPRAGYDWSGLDGYVALASRSRLEVLPFLYGTPDWLAGRETNLPVGNARQRQAWAAFVRAAAERYGTNGSYWREHWRGSGDFVPRNPIKRWQIWNEENFFYFTTPASPKLYAQLLKISNRAIKRGDPRAEILVGGLFGRPKPRPPRGMDATTFLNRLYRVPGIKNAFDGVSLHPYSADTRALRQLALQVRRTVLRNGDPRAGLYITEMGWGSQRSNVSFEVGWRPQARELRRSYRFLLRNQRRLNLKQVYWFTWKDILGACSFCDSSGLFRRGPLFKPKPAWHSLVRIARGR